VRSPSLRHAAAGTQGLGVGIIGAVALPLAGVASGCVQIARGVYNTPEALGHGWAADAFWDEQTGSWSKLSIQVRALPCPRPPSCVRYIDASCVRLCGG
jgi:hypothetical protein